jgi:hypothetical protein
MAGFDFKLVLEDGTPADPPKLKAAVPNWEVGDTIPLGRGTVWKRSEAYRATARRRSCSV